MPKHRRRILVEECRHLDVNRLGRPITPGAAGLRLNNGQTIDLVWTPCNFGGKRPWLLCPCCFRRCAKLLDYRDHGFRCRRCYGAGYAIENDTPEWRLRRRIEKLEGQLAEDSERPKGMHDRTYQRLCGVIADLETAADALFFEKICRRWPELLVF